MAGVSNLFDRRAECTNFNLVGGQTEMPKASRGEGNGEGCPPPQPIGGLGSIISSLSTPAENEFGVFYSLKKTHLIDTNLIIFLTFLRDFAGQIEMPGGPDCGPRAVCWTLLMYDIHIHFIILLSEKCCRVKQLMLLFNCWL